MQSFGIGTFVRDNVTFAGIVRDEYVWNIRDLFSDERIETTRDLLEDWERLEALLVEQADALDASQAYSIDELSVRPPVHPRQIFCTGANYCKHVIELISKQPDPATADMTPAQRADSVAKVMDERVRNGTPFAFSKLPSSVTGPYDHVILPEDGDQPDWELELAVVIGKAARKVKREDALSYVAGYTIANDLTLRERVYRTDMKALGADWLASKCAPTFLPLGPWITPARFVADPQNLQIELKLNGKVMQDENTADMIFDISRQIEYISAHVQILPGDVICTGSPAGNGTHYGRFLTPGDVLESSITGLGHQRNLCVAEAAI